MEIAPGHQLKNLPFATIVFGMAAAVLAFEPIRWLINTWRDPSYDSQGFIVFCVCLGLFVWSFSSPRRTHAPDRAQVAVLLLAATALIRLLGQVLAVNIIGAIALVVDVYAIALLFGLPDRRRVVSPGWLALCFAFALPIERIVQRVAGYGLQHISADGACLVLGSFFDNVACNGIRILLNNQDVLIDLPCSGARSIVFLLLFYAATMAVSRPPFALSVAGLVITLGVSVMINVLRISTLAIGIAFPDAVGVDVMAAPWHDLIGLTALALGCIPIIFWARFVGAKSTQPLTPARRSTFLGKVTDFRIRPLWSAFGLLAVALTIVNLPKTPVDISQKNIPVALPASIDGRAARPIALSSYETLYFTEYGGTAKKAAYGQHSLLVVRTSAPLRHLHNPEICLRGLGFDVAYQGIFYDPLPTSIYKATSPDGQSYRVAVTFTSDQGDVSTNISEVVWRWLNDRSTVWSGIQRISPWDMNAAELNDWDRAIASILDINPELHLTATNLKGEDHV